MRKDGTKGTGRKRFQFTGMRGIIAVFLLLTVVLCTVQMNVPYEKQEFLLEPREDLPAEMAAAGKSECMIFWQDDANGQNGLELMEAVLGQMKIPYSTCNGSSAAEVDLQ